MPLPAPCRAKVCIVTERPAPPFRAAFRTRFVAPAQAGSCGSDPCCSVLRLPSVGAIGQVSPRRATSLLVATKKGGKTPPTAAPVRASALAAPTPGGSRQTASGLGTSTRQFLPAAGCSALQRKAAGSAHHCRRRVAHRFRPAFGTRFVAPAQAGPALDPAVRFSGLPSVGGGGRSRPGGGDLLSCGDRRRQNALPQRRLAPVPSLRHARPVASKLIRRAPDIDATIPPAAGLRSALQGCCRLGFAIAGGLWYPSLRAPHPGTIHRPGAGPGPGGCRLAVPVLEGAFGWR